MLQFYDYEVFEYDWLVVIIDLFNKKVTKIHNDSSALSKYFYEHNEEIWIGYNNLYYDQYIHKAILSGSIPKRVNDWIIRDKKFGYQYSDAFKYINMVNYDVMKMGDGGLKSLEGFMGEDIRESSVPFDIKRPLTQKEIEETFDYCKWDVEKTIDVFFERKAEFDAALGIVKAFKLPLFFLSKTNAQKVAHILGGNYNHITSDQFDFMIIYALKLNKYSFVRDWYLQKENHDYEKFQSVMIAGIPHVLRWGGIHGAPDEPYHGTGIFIMADVTAYYPSLQIEYKLGYRSMDRPDNLSRIHGENLRFKSIGDKAARLPYKIADNSISGQLKDPKSSLYDPRENNAVCVNGQLFLVDLIEKLEPYIELVQSNTDGILFKIESMDVFDTIDEIVYEWECRTKMRMGFDFYREIYQKDVNNYIAIGFDGKTKTKGGYVKDLSRLDYDLPIINKALVDYMVNKVPIETTIYGCDDLIMFQKIVKLSSKYLYTEHNGKRLREKCNRVFASTNPNDGSIYKCKYKTKLQADDWGGSYVIDPHYLAREKFANTPERCYIYNENVQGMKTDKKLDKDWYVDLAYRRLKQFGG